MTICLNEKALIKRQAKKKILGEFRDVYDNFLELEFKLIRNGDPLNRVAIFKDKPDITIGDRIYVDDQVMEVKNVQYHESVNETAAACVLNDFETGWEQLSKLGCDVKYGIVEAAKDFEGEHVMDAWVGTFIVNATTRMDEIRSGRHIGDFYGLFNHDVPVAVVGAGPSLDKNVDQLKRFPGIIICADRAYKMLLARSITPDIVFSVDCHYDLIAEMLDCPFSPGQKLILNVCSDPRVRYVWRGPIFWYSMKHPGVQFTDKILPALFPRIPALENVGCVGNSMILFSEYAGLSPVVLVGQDFGYTGGKMFAQEFDIAEDGTAVPKLADHVALLEKRTGKVETMGIDSPIVTYAPFLSYRDTLYDLHKHRNINIVNCTEGGILRNIPSKTLAQMNDALMAKSNGKYAEAKKLIKSI